MKEIFKSKPSDLMGGNYPRLDELIKRMEELAIKAHRKQIERAVVRIIYGGLIQRAPTKNRLSQLLKEYVDYITTGLNPKLTQEYQRILSSSSPMTVWITTKVVMELLECCDPAFSIDQCEFYNLFYGPILYYQDRNHEIETEQYGVGVGASISEVNKTLPKVDDMKTLLTSCKSLCQDIIGSPKLPEDRKTQLNLLMKVYRNRLPQELTAVYAQF